MHCIVEAQKIYDKIITKGSEYSEEAIFKERIGITQRMIHCSMTVSNPMAIEPPGRPSVTADAASQEQPAAVDTFVHDNDFVSDKSGTIGTNQHNPSGSGEASLRSRLSLYMNDQIDATRADTILIVCAFISGMVDSVCYNAWGSFACMQSGTYDPIASEAPIGTYTID